MPVEVPPDSVRDRLGQRWPKRRRSRGSVCFRPVRTTLKASKVLPKAKRTVRKSNDVLPKAIRAVRKPNDVLPKAIRTVRNALGKTCSSEFRSNGSRNRAFEPDQSKSLRSYRDTNRSVEVPPDSVRLQRTCRGGPCVRPSDSGFLAGLPKSFVVAANGSGEIFERRLLAYTIPSGLGSYPSCTQGGAALRAS